MFVKEAVEQIELLPTTRVFSSAPQLQPTKVKIDSYVM